MIVDAGSGNQSSDNVKPQQEKDSSGVNSKSQGPSQSQNNGQGDMPKYKVVNYDYNSSVSHIFNGKFKQALSN